MSRFNVYAGGTLVGHSELETGDPPMGVAIGRFYPLPAYVAIQAACIAARNQSQEHLALSVRDSGGSVIPAQGGTAILDSSRELGEIEVHVLGIGYPLYEELFPAHVAAYRKQFSAAG